MNKTKNRAGFTLVELVVVITMFSILFGAILNLLQPVNKSFQDAESVTNTNKVGSVLNRYIEGQIRFSTNILVLNNYQGVPEVSATGNLGNSPISYTDCIILDNSHTRGTQLSGTFDSDANVSRRMGCTGTVLHIGEISPTNPFSLANTEIGMGEDFYGNESYHFDGSLVKQENLVNFKLTTSAYQYTTDNSGNYHFDDKLRFSSEREFDLINVNYDFSDNYFAKVLDFSDSSLYSTYKQASAPGGLSDGQNAFYSDGNKYTYIFYTKSTADTNCTLTFNCKKPSDHSDQISTLTVAMGKSVVFSQVPSLQIVPGYDAPYFTCTQTGDNLRTEEDWSNLKITENLTFTAVYPLSSSSTTYTAYFKNVDGSNASFSGPTGIQILGSPFTASCAFPPDEFNDSTYAAKHSFMGWVTSTGTPIENCKLTSDGTVFVPVVQTKPSAKFKINGALVPALEQIVDYGMTASAADSSGVTPPSGKVFAGWVKEGSGEPIESYVLTADTVFVPKFVNEPASALSVVNISDPVHSAWGCVQYTVKIANTSSSTVNVWKITGSLTREYKEIKCANWKLDSYVTVTGSTFTGTTINDPWNYFSIPAGDTITLTLTCRVDGSDITDFSETAYKLGSNAIKVQKVS